MCVYIYIKVKETKGVERSVVSHLGKQGKAFCSSILKIPLSEYRRLKLTWEEEISILPTPIIIKQDRQGKKTIQSRT